MAKKKSMSLADFKSAFGVPEEKEPPKPDIIHAPYNFVSLSDTVIEFPEEERVNRETVDEELLSGEIGYTITAETPIMVNIGFEENGMSKGFFIDAKTGKYALPGSTVRGLIRTNVQILGLADVSDDIDDVKFMFREIAQGKDAKEYNSITGAKQVQEEGAIKSIVTNVRAGYIEKRKDGYHIIPTIANIINDSFEYMNYYTISEIMVLKNRKSFPALFPEGAFILQNKKITKEKSIVNEDYYPYYMEVSYDVASKKVVGIDNPGKLKYKGYVVSTGRMQGKRSLYLIPEENKAAGTYKIPPNAVLAFKADYERKKNGLDKDSGPLDIQYSHYEYFDLPKEGEKKPVFYMRYEGELYFGFTPRLRLFNRHSTHEGIPVKTKDGNIDFARSIFGYSVGKSAYKSKVSFSNAVICGDQIEEKAVSLVLSEPKPTFYPAYLKGTGKKNSQPVSYNDEQIKLRGIKQYWIKESADPGEKGNNEKVISAFKPLPKGSEFKGCIRYDNLTPQELGLLLWAISLDGKCKLNIGYAKPYGYGAIKIRIDNAKRTNIEKAYSTERFCMDPTEALDINEYIGIYKEYAKGYLGKNIDQLTNITEFFYMKDEDIRPIEGDMKYMKLETEYNENIRKSATLPGPGQLIHKAKEWKKENE